MLAKMLMPETGKPETAGKVDIEIEKPGVNVIDAAARGAGDGLHLALNVGAHADRVPGADRDAQRRSRAGCYGLPRRWSGSSASLFAPVAWLMGVRWKDCHRDRQPARHAPGAERIRRLPAARADEEPRSTRARSPSPPTRCAASPTSARSPSRSAASARWRPAANPTWRASACARWPPARWPTSCPPASRECCYESMKPSNSSARRAAGRRPRSPSCSGSGLGAFADELTGRVEIPYAEIPGWPQSTAVGPRRQAGRSACCGAAARSP